ncbi:MAG: 4Fe-4S binding protein [Anaerolineae bacterium]
MPVQCDYAISVNGRAVVNWEACMGCGVCVGQCRNEAMSLVRDERKGVPLDVRALSAIQ